MDSHRTSLNVALTDIAQARVQRDQRHGTERHGDELWLTMLASLFGDIASWVGMGEPTEENEADFIDVLRHRIVLLSALVTAWIEALDARRG